MQVKVNSGDTYKSAEIKSDCSKITGQHSEEIKTVPKPVHVST